jgi:hypothetical protein
MSCEDEPFFGAWEARFGWPLIGPGRAHPCLERLHAAYGSATWSMSTPTTSSAASWACESPRTDLSLPQRSSTAATSWNVVIHVGSGVGMGK